MIQVTTQTGSIYLIDHEAKTWKQLHSDNNVERDYPLRTTEGTFQEAKTPQIGQSFMMLCPPINPKASGRLIITSPVTRIDFVEKA